MRNYARVVPVLAVCLAAAVFVKLAAAAPTQNFGPASGTIPDAATAQPKSQPPPPPPKAAPTVVTVAPKKVAAPATDSAELKKLRAELDDARAEAAQAKKNAVRVADLENENKELNAKLTAAEKKASVKPVAPADSAEVKKLRGDLEKARADTAQARAEAGELRKQAVTKPVIEPAEVKNLQAQLSQAQKEAEQAKTKSAARMSELQKQNTDLSVKLGAAQKSAAAAPSEAPDARVMKRLRNENSYLRNLLDTYTAKNPELKGQLRRYEQESK